jgi:polar amino acid transport system substrate-binding protein
MNARLGRWLLLLAAANLALPAFAACSRPLKVPVSPIGLSVVVKGQDVSGVFPELLASLGGKAGCRFTWSVVPRARLELMFEQGQADMLVAATQSARRDQFGLFIPLVNSRATLVTVGPKRAPIATMDQLLARRELRVALVRGFDYGPDYLDLVKKLAAQGRLILEPDPTAVARLMQAGIVDATIMPPTAIIGAAQGDPRLDGLAARLHSEALDELPWRKSGVYLSNAALSIEDRAALEQWLSQAGKSGALWKAYQRYYPPALLAESTRPL